MWNGCGFYADFTKRSDKWLQDKSTIYWYIFAIVYVSDDSQPSCHRSPWHPVLCYWPLNSA